MAKKPRKAVVKAQPGSLVPEHSPRVLEEMILERATLLAQNTRQTVRVYRRVHAFSWPWPMGDRETPGRLGALSYHAVYFIKLEKDEAPRDAVLVVEILV